MDKKWKIIKNNATHSAKDGSWYHVHPYGTIYASSSNQEVITALLMLAQEKTEALNINLWYTKQIEKTLVKQVLEIMSLIDKEG